MVLLLCIWEHGLSRLVCMQMRRLGPQHSCVLMNRKQRWQMDMQAHLQPPSLPLVLGHVEIPFDPVATP